MLSLDPRFLEDGAWKDIFASELAVASSKDDLGYLRTRSAELDSIQLSIIRQLEQRGKRDGANWLLVIDDVTEAAERRESIIETIACMRQVLENYSQTGIVEQQLLVPLLVARRQRLQGLREQLARLNALNDLRQKHFKSVEVGFYDEVRSKIIFRRDVGKLGGRGNLKAIGTISGQLDAGKVASELLLRVFLDWQSRIVVSEDLRTRILHLLRQLASVVLDARELDSEFGGLELEKMVWYAASRQVTAALRSITAVQSGSSVDQFASVIYFTYLFSRMAPDEPIDNLRTSAAAEEIVAEAGVAAPPADPAVRSFAKDSIRCPVLQQQLEDSCWAYYKSFHARVTSKVVLMIENESWSRLPVRFTRRKVVLHPHMSSFDFDDNQGWFEASAKEVQNLNPFIGRDSLWPERLFANCRSELNSIEEISGRIDMVLNQSRSGGEDLKDRLPVLTSTSVEMLQRMVDYFWVVVWCPTLAVEVFQGLVHLFELVLGNLAFTMLPDNTSKKLSNLVRLSDRKTMEDNLTVVRLQQSHPELCKLLRYLRRVVAARDQTELRGRNKLIAAAFGSQLPKALQDFDNYSDLFATRKRATAVESVSHLLWEFDDWLGMRGSNDMTLRPLLTDKEWQVVRRESSRLKSIARSLRSLILEDVAHKCILHYDKVLGFIRKSKKPPTGTSLSNQLLAVSRYLDDLRVVLNCTGQGAVPRTWEVQQWTVMRAEVINLGFAAILEAMRGLRCEDGVTEAYVRGTGEWVNAVLEVSRLCETPLDASEKSSAEPELYDTMTEASRNFHAAWSEGYAMRLQLARSSVEAFGEWGNLPVDEVVGFVKFWLPKGSLPFAGIRHVCKVVEPQKERRAVLIQEVEAWTATWIKNSSQAVLT